MKCHQSEHCGMSEEVGPSITDNCIDCHMPKESSDFLKMYTSEGTVFPPLRDHHIRVDEEATKRFLSGLKDKD